MIYWLLTTEFPPFYGGGISTYCYHTAQMLVQKQHQVTVLIPNEHVNDYEISMSGDVRLVQFNPDRTGVSKFLGYVPRLSYEFAMMVRELIIQEGKPDYIESQEYLAIPYYLLQFKLLGYEAFDGVSIVLTLHSPAFLYLLYNREGVYEFPNYWTGELEKSCIAAADLVLAPSRYIVDEIKKHGLVAFEEQKVCVIRNPYQSPDTSFQRVIKRNKILFFGKLSPQKGVFEMFGYLKNLWESGFKHPLTVVGGTEKVYYPEMKTMGQLIEDKYKKYFEQGLVQFKGKIHPDQKEEVLSDAHVILIPSLNDNLPYAAIEAMSLGKVVLASRQGGQREIIEDGVTGFLFDHSIAGNFESKLKQVLALNDEELIRIGQAAKESIQHTLQYETIYQHKMEALQQVQQTNPNTFPFTRELPVRCDHKTSGELLSVVIPFYNLGSYVQDTVRSLLACNHKEKEIIIVNDGSTDPHSLNVLKQLEQTPGVQVVHKKNEGLAESRNYGARTAKGEFLAFLDADDTVQPDYYSKAIRVLKQYDNVAFVATWVQYFGKKNGTWPTWNPEPPYVLIHNSVNSSALVYKTAAFLKGGINDRQVDYGIEDYESVVNMLNNGCRGVVLPECLFNYRIRHDSMYRGLTRHKNLYSYNYIAQKHAELYRLFAAEIFSLLNANGPSFAFDNPSLPVTVTSTIRYPNALFNRVKKAVKKNTKLKKILLRINNQLKIRQA